MEIEDDKYPTLKSRIGQKGVIVQPITKEKVYFEILDEILMPQSGAKNKRLCFQKIMFTKDKRIELRLGYYIIGKKPKMRGKWVWGQFSMMIPIKDFIVLIEEAKSRGWFLENEKN